MELQHIELENLKTTKLNVRKFGAKDITDLLPSIRSLGILQPLLVRKNCEGYEVIAGQRRYYALNKLAEDGEIEPVPCIVMKDGDDAKAIEASLAENIARLPMDEIDQYKAFSALMKQGETVEEIADQFGITTRLVKRRLAIANLIAPVLTAYRKDQISVGTVRSLTLATKSKQKEWWELFQSDEYAPQGHSLKAWLLGGNNIPVSNALFGLSDYDGNIVSDLFGDEQYFDDANKFWECQNIAIAKAKEIYLTNGWSEVIILDIGDYWYSSEFSKTPKTKGGKICVQIANDGEVTFHEGYLTHKEAQHLECVAKGEVIDEPKPNAELTKIMQNYLALHRHSAVRTEMLGHSGVALRLAIAQIIAGSSLWNVQADPQKANTDTIGESLATNKAEDIFSEERERVRTLLGMEDITDDTLVYRKNDWGKSHDLYALFAKLIELDDASVNMILTFIVAETLPCGSAMVEVLGGLLKIDMAKSWSPDQTFFDLLRDKEAINVMLKQVAGKNVADAHITSTAKVQKKIIQDSLNEKPSGRKKTQIITWQPRYMAFPMSAYTKRSGIEAIDQQKAVNKYYK